MDISLKAKMCLPLLIILAVGFLYACGSPAPPANQPQTTIQPLSDSSGLPGKVDVVYFHRPVRCPTCLCFEERVTYVVKTYFQDELNKGKLTLQIYNLGDSKNADIVKKYGAVGPQLFINSVKDGAEHVKNIEEIWSWNCRGNKQGFDQKVRSVIEQSLRGVG